MELKLLNRKEYKKYLNSMVDLYNMTFNDKVNEDYFNWRYMENPFEDTLLMAVAIDEGKVVSSYSACPYYLSKEDKVIKSALILHTMTHPNYKGKGLFPKLGKLLYDFLSNNQYEIIWGFPNKIIHAARINKLGWSDIYEYPTMTLSLNDVIVSSSSINIDANFECELDFETSSKIRVIKSKEYIKWRYKNHPLTKYRIAKKVSNNQITSFAIMKEYQDKINIVDYNFSSYKEFEEVLSTIIYTAVKEGFNEITTWANLNTKEKLYFERLEFKNTTPITYFSGLLLQEKSNDITLNSNDWHIYMGDDNVY